MRTKRNLILTVFLISALLLGGAITSLGVMAEEGQYGGTLTFADQEPIVSFDLHSEMRLEELLMLVYEGLTYYDEEFVARPHLATDWEASDDLMTWTFYLREGVEFHDGTPMTADDVIASFDRFMEMGSRAWEFERVESWEAIDDHTVRFYLNEPWAVMPESFALPGGGLAVYPEWLMDEVGTGEIGYDNFLAGTGTGPYTLEEWEPGEVARFVRNENYVGPEYEAGLHAGERKAYLDEIIYRPIEDPATRISALLAGEVDVIRPVPSDDLERLRQDENIEVVISEIGERVYFKLNPNEGVFTDPLLRKAVRAAVNPEEMLSVLGPDEAWRVNTTPRYTVFQQYWDDYTDRYFPMNVELAEYLVEESDYDGEEVRLVYASDTTDDRVTIMLIEALQDIGLNVRGISSDHSTWFETKFELDQWDISHSSGGPEVPVAYLDASSRTRAGDPWSWRDAEFEYWFNETQTTLDHEEYLNAVDNMFRLMYEGNSEIWIGDEMYIVGTADHVRGLTPFDITSKTIFLRNVWVE